MSDYFNNLFGSFSDSFCTFLSVTIKLPSGAYDGSRASLVVSAGYPDLLRWAIGIHQLQRRRRLFKRMKAEFEHYLLIAIPG